MRTIQTSLRRGFSLLELSIVLGIISLIAGAGMSMASGAIKAADRITTQERLNTIKLALDSFAKTYGYLPCPFDRALTPTSATFGVEARTAGTSTCVAAAPGIITAENIWFGGVPVRTLGLPDSYAADAWGNKLTYAVTSFLIENPVSYSTRIGTITMRYGDRTAPDANTFNITSQRTSLAYTSVTPASNPTRLNFVSTGSLANGMIVHVKSTSGVYNGSYVVVSRTATTIDLTGSTLSSADTGTVEWQEAGTNVGYAVVSHGPDGRGAFPFSGTAIPSTKLCNTSATANTSPPPCTSSATTTCIDIENCNEASVTVGHPSTFFDMDYNDGTQAAQYFDDYIVWGSNDVFRAPVNTTLYTGATSNCPTGGCEAWCAACSVNYPGGSASATPMTPPALITTASTAVLFKKVITSDSTICAAACFWSGSTAAGYLKAP
jgi:prepilin-type N-terminal cleavage/methylation domain-containing protein